MSSPLVFGDTGVAEKLLNAGRDGRDVNFLSLGDSIYDQCDSEVIHAWRPYSFSGYLDRGGLFTGLGTGVCGVNTGFSPGQAGSAVTGGNMTYSLFGSMESVFNGTATGADANVASNRQTVDYPSVYGPVNRPASTFAGADLLNGKTVQTKWWFFTDAQTEPNIRVQVRDVTNIGTTLLQSLVLPTSTGYYDSGYLTGSAANADDYALETRLPQNYTSTNGKRWAHLGTILRRQDPGLIYMPGSVGGWAVDTYNNVANITSAALTACLQLSKADIVRIGLTANNPGSYDQATYVAKLTTLVASIRSALPNAQIIFHPTWDINGSGGDTANPQSPLFTDAHYTVCQSTPGSLFLNGFLADGTRAQNIANGYAASTNPHPPTTLAKWVMAQQFWSLVERAAGNGRFVTMTGSQSTHRLRGRQW